MLALLGRHLLEALADPLTLRGRQSLPTLLILDDALLLVGGQRLELPEAIHDLVAPLRRELLEALIGILQLSAPRLGKLVPALEVLEDALAFLGRHVPELLRAAGRLSSRAEAAAARG